MTYNNYKSHTQDQGKIGSPKINGMKRRKTDDFESKASPIKAGKKSFEKFFPGKENALKVACKDFDFLNDDVTSIVAHQQALCGNRDDLHYSQAWYVHYKRREPLFKPWNPTVTAAGLAWEQLRLLAINNMWKAVKNYRISPITVHVGVWLMNRLLVAQLKKNPSFNKDTFACTVAVAFRTALKFEERPEALWGIRKIWEVLPMFDTWNIDRSEKTLMRIESEGLRLLDDCVDVPLSTQFFDKFIAVGGWPTDVAAQYTALGHFLLALSTFASGDQNPVCGTPPSKLAAAAVVLAVKIVNGDSRRSYEFFPPRLAAFCGLSFRELQPVIKGFSNMLRHKPEDVSCPIPNHPLLSFRTRHISPCSPTLPMTQHTVFC